MAIEVPQSKNISEEWKDRGRKGVAYTMRQRRENRGNINIKE